MKLHKPSFKKFQFLFFATRKPKNISAAIITKKNAKPEKNGKPKLFTNNISILPDFIYSMKNIEYLDLSDNKIKEIGNDIRFLKKMKTLNLKNNNIEVLPKSITNLKSLEFFDITGNPIKKLPSPEKFFFNIKKFFINLGISTGKK